MDENWIPIKEFEGLYEVSDKGRVRRTFHEGVDVMGRHFIKSERLLKANKDKKGYLYVSLHGNRRIHKKVHRLVMKNFREVNNPNLQVNHIDGNKENNEISNLEWVTPHENMMHAYNTGLHRKFKGSENHCSKKVGQYDKNGKLIKIWGSVSDAERFYNTRAIGNVVRGLRKTSKGFIWRFV